MHPVTRIKTECHYIQICFPSGENTTSLSCSKLRFHLYISIGQTWSNTSRLISPINFSAANRRFRKLSLPFLEMHPPPRHSHKTFSISNSLHAINQVDPNIHNPKLCSQNLLQHTPNPQHKKLLNITEISNVKELRFCKKTL